MFTKNILYLIISRRTDTVVDNHWQVYLIIQQFFFLDLGYVLNSAQKIIHQENISQLM